MKGKILDDLIKIMGLYLFILIVINVKYGLINGVECVIKNIDYRVENFSILSIIWVLFLDVDIGKK